MCSIFLPGNVTTSALKTLLSILLLLCLASATYSQDTEPDSARAAKIAKFNDWNWRISPYAWVPAIRGRVTTPPMPVQLPEPPPPFFDFTILFKELRSHLKFLSVMSAEYRLNRFRVLGRFDAIVIESRPVLIFEDLLANTTMDFALYGADLTAGYNFVEHPKVEVVGYAGLRLIHFKVGINTNPYGTSISAQRTKSYFDPVIATKIIYKPHYRWEFVAWADITPIPLESNYSFQGIAVFSYHFSPVFFLAPGYRFVAHRKTDPDVTYFDGNVRGFYLRIGFQF